MHNSYQKKLRKRPPEIDFKRKLTKTCKIRSLLMTLHITDSVLDLFKIN